MAEKKREITYSTGKKRGLSLRKLESLLKSWQSKLVLDDWNLSLKIVDFQRKDGFRQSGDIKIKAKNKEATVLLTHEPFKDEEEVLVHELIHLLLWEYDTFAERTILKNCDEFKGDHSKYMDKLESTVKKLTDIFVYNKKRRAD